jgi:hypothetical protein
MRFTPDRDRRFEPARTLFRQPDRAPALIVLRDGDFDQPRGFQAAQIARQRRLIEPRALRKRAERIVGSGHDLRHQAELGKAQSAVLDTLLEEIGDAACGKAARVAGAAGNRRLGVAHESLCWGLRSFAHQVYVPTSFVFTRK